MKIRGAIFDMDGTLLDSMHIWERLPVEYLRERGISPPEDLLGILAHMTLTEAAEYLRTGWGLCEDSATVLRDMLTLSERMYETVEPKPGVPEALLLLSRHGVRMAVATLTDRPAAERVLCRLGLLPYFGAIFTCAEVGAPKTSPRVYEAALSYLGTPREATPVFEDAYYAIRTAHAAHFPVAAVYDASSHCHHARATALADIVIDDWQTLDLSLYL
ncbi:MAG: HAD family phosphatase [Clostridia bacterium]|nr:HAD family phosphatase [Clostridia bacterium]